MSLRSFLLSDALDRYVREHTEAPDEVLQALAEETARLPEAGMQIGPDVGTLLTMLTGLTGARLAVEVGTFTGYSSISIARGLAPGGRLLCFDVSERYTSIARRYWKLAGVDDRIDLTIGPAIDGLRALPAGAGIDLAFIDADKESYPAYLAELVPRVRPGGLIVADNALLEGAVASAGGPPEWQGAIEGVRRYNDEVVADPRVDAVLLAMSDGISIARTRVT